MGEIILLQWSCIIYILDNECSFFGKKTLWIRKQQLCFWFKLTKKNSTKNFFKCLCHLMLFTFSWFKHNELCHPFSVIILHCARHGLLLMHLRLCLQEFPSFLKNSYLVCGYLVIDIAVKMLLLQDFAIFFSWFLNLLMTESCPSPFRVLRFVAVSLWSRQAGPRLVMQWLDQWASKTNTCLSSTSSPHTSFLSLVFAWAYFNYYSFLISFQSIDDCLHWCYSVLLAK